MARCNYRSEKKNATMSSATWCFLSLNLDAYLLKIRLNRHLNMLSPLKIVILLRKNCIDFIQWSLQTQLPARRCNNLFNHLFMIVSWYFNKEAALCWVVTHRCRCYQPHGDDLSSVLRQHHYKHRTAAVTRASSLFPLWLSN